MYLLVGLGNILILLANSDWSEPQSMVWVPVCSYNIIAAMLFYCAEGSSSMVASCGACWVSVACGCCISIVEVFFFVINHVFCRWIKQNIFVCHILCVSLISVAFLHLFLYLFMPCTPLFCVSTSLHAPFTIDLTLYRYLYAFTYAV